MSTTESAYYQAWMREKARRIQLEQILGRLLGDLANLHSSWIDEDTLKKSERSQYQMAATLGAYDESLVLALDKTETNAHRVLSGLEPIE